MESSDGAPNAPPNAPARSAPPGVANRKGQGLSSSTIESKDSESSFPSAPKLLLVEASHVRGCACDGRNLGSAREWLEGLTRHERGRSASLGAAGLGLRGEAGKNGLAAEDDVTVEFCMASMRA